MNICTVSKQHLSTDLHEIVEKSVLPHSQANIKTQLPCLAGVEKRPNFCAQDLGSTRITQINTLLKNSALNKYTVPSHYNHNLYTKMQPFLNKNSKCLLNIPDIELNNKILILLRQPKSKCAGNTLDYKLLWTESHHKDYPS